MAVSGDIIRRAWGNFPSGVSVITTGGQEGDVYGMTAIRVMLGGIEPPMVLFLLGRQRQTYENIERQERFGLNILAGDQAQWADYCAKPPEERSAYPPTPYLYAPTGTAIIEGALAFMDCRAVAKYEVTPTTLLFLGEVESIEVREGMPLLFHRGEYLDPVGEGG